MIFIDASALCAMITNEHDALDLADRLINYSERTTPPLAIWETVISVCRILDIDHSLAAELVQQFLLHTEVKTISIVPNMSEIALEARRQYGKGPHPAALNFGDCFSYACAKFHRMPLLYKGSDFALTDIRAA